LGIDDARQLRGVDERSVDLVVTSPPYAGVFDYVEHHRLRLRWLDLDADDFNQRELGARRALGRDGRARALEHWQRELHQVLTTLRRVLKPGGRVAWLMADSTVEGRAVFADDVLHAVAPRAGLSILGAAAQQRPSFSPRERNAFKHRLRQEHLFLLGASEHRGPAKAAR
jgi:DNA modification methylase